MPIKSLLLLPPGAWQFSILTPCINPPCRGDDESSIGPPRGSCRARVSHEHGGHFAGPFRPQRGGSSIDGLVCALVPPGQRAPRPPGKVDRLLHVPAGAGDVGQLLAVPPRIAGQCLAKLV